MSPSLHIQLTSGELVVSLEVFLAGMTSHVCGEGRSGWLLVPANLLEVIANVLLIVGFLRLARLILVGRPETGGIRSENFIRERDAPRRAPELEFGIGDDDTALPGIVRRSVVEV